MGVPAVNTTPARGPRHRSAMTLDAPMPSNQPASRADRSDSGVPSRSSVSVMSAAWAVADCRRGPAALVAVPVASGAKTLVDRRVPRHAVMTCGARPALHHHPRPIRRRHRPWDRLRHRELEGMWRRLRRNQNHRGGSGRSSSSRRCAVRIGAREIPCGRGDGSLDHRQQLQDQERRERRQHEFRMAATNAWSYRPKPVLLRTCLTSDSRSMTA